MAARRSSTGDGCFFSLSVGGTTVGALARTKLAEPHDFIAWGVAPLTVPTFQPLGGTLEAMLTAKNPAIAQFHRMSPSSLAFGLMDAKPPSLTPIRMPTTSVKRVCVYSSTSTVECALVGVVVGELLGTTGIASYE